MAALVLDFTGFMKVFNDYNSLYSRRAQLQKQFTVYSLYVIGHQFSLSY